MAVIGEVLKQVEEFYPKVSTLTEEIRKKIVGQDKMVNRLLIALFSNGHILLEGVPGLAKTTLVDTVAKSLKLDFKRIQFTPDLLPADIIGTMVYDPKNLNFVVKKGPVFTNVLLADEINRAPSKVQSALLESMQERQVTIGDQTYNLAQPFLVLATQNPIEQSGTYQLPEAQLDRFMMKVVIGYPSKQQEAEIVDVVLKMREIDINEVFDADMIRKGQELSSKVYIDKKLVEYIVNIVDATRFPQNSGLENLADYIEFGASPRATINMVITAKTNAMLKNRAYVIPDDIKSLAHDILRHRVILTYEAEAEGVKADDVISEILDKIEVP